MPLRIEAESPPPLNPLYDVEFVQDPIFAVKITRKSTGTVIFDSSLGGLTLADQFLQIGAKIPSSNVFGLGEHEHHSLRHNMSWSSWGNTVTI